MKRQTGTVLLLLLLLLIVGLAGVACVRGNRPAPDLTYLEIDPGTAPAPSGGSQDVLLLRRLDVQSPFDDRRFLYKTGSGTYESDYYVRFVASPADLLTDRLEIWLDESRLFQAVVESGSTAEYRYVLEGEILELYGDYSSPGQVTAVISSEFVLVDDLDGAGRIVFNKQYRQAEPAASSDAGALATSWGSALRQIFLQLTTDLQVLLAKQNGTY
jgi:cholesterol transport system auxiliary component